MGIKKSKIASKNWTLDATEAASKKKQFDGCVTDWSGDLDAVKVRRRKSTKFDGV